MIPKPAVQVPPVDRSARRVRVWFLLIFLTALVVRVIPLSRPGTEWAKGANFWDSNGYIQLANGMRSGCGFARRTSDGCSAPELLRTPGYPLFLAAFPNLRAALAVQALIGALISVLAGYPTYIRFGRNAGLLTAALIACDLPSVVWSGQIMSETLFAFLLTVSVVSQYFMLSPSANSRHPIRSTLFSASFLALAIIVKPIAIVLIPVSAGAILLMLHVGWRQRLVLLLVFLVVPTLVVAGWTERNARTTGVSTFSVISAKNLYFYRAARVIQYVSHWQTADVQQFLDRNIDMPEGFSIKSDGPIRQQSAKAIAQMTAFGRQTLMAHPFTFVKLSMLDFVYLLLTPGLADTQAVLESRPESPLSSPPQTITEKVGGLASASKVVMAAILFHWCLLFVTYAGVIRAVVLCRSLPLHKIGTILFFLLIALVLLAAAAGPEGGARLRVPAIPLLSMVAAFGVCCGRARTLKKQEL